MGSQLVQNLELGPFQFGDGQDDEAGRHQLENGQSLRCGGNRQGKPAPGFDDPFQFVSLLLVLPNDEHRPLLGAQGESVGLRGGWRGKLHGKSPSTESPVR